MPYSRSRWWLSSTTEALCVFFRCVCMCTAVTMHFSFMLNMIAAKAITVNFCTRKLLPSVGKCVREKQHYWHWFPLGAVWMFSKQKHLNLNSSLARNPVANGRSIRAKRTSTETAEDGTFQEECALWTKKASFIQKWRVSKVSGWT